MATSRRRRWIDAVPDPLLNNSKVVFTESFIVLMIAWAVFAHAFDLTDTVASPLIVAGEIYDIVTTDGWEFHVIETLRRVIYGFLLTIAIGTIWGVLMGWSTFWEKALQDYITIGLALPSLFAAVFAAMWFGNTDTTPMVAGALISFPFLTQNVYEGAKDIDNELLKMSTAFDLSRRRVVWRVIVKSVLPEWFAGARYAFAICWKVTTLAEFIVAPSGIGYMIQLQMSIFSLSGVLAWTFIFTFIILILEYGVLRRIETRVFSWREETSIGWA